MSPSADLVAQLLVYLVARRNDDVGRDATRVRITRESLKRVCGRDSLQDRFVDRIISSLPSYGWVGFRTPDDDLALIRLDRVRAWTAVSTKRLLRVPVEEGTDRDISRTLRAARQSDDAADRAERYAELELLLRSAGVLLEPEDDLDQE